VKHSDWNVFYMGMSFVKAAGPATTFAALLWLTGCASTDTPPATAARALCPPNRTPSCVEYLGKKMRCFCGTMDDLERILEPDPLFR